MLELNDIARDVSPVIDQQLVLDLSPFPRTRLQGNTTVLVRGGLCRESVYYLYNFR